jgi:hypothetical protein
MAALLLGLAAWPARSAAQPHAAWFGTWRLNLSKSSDSPEARTFKSQTCVIEPWQDGLRVTYDIVGVRGGIRHLEWTGAFDGRDYMVQGIDYVLTHAFTLVNERTYTIVVKMDGAVVATTTNELSPDGRTITAVTTGRNAAGQPVTTTSIFEKQ